MVKALRKQRQPKFRHLFVAPESKHNMLGREEPTSRELPNSYAVSNKMLKELFFFRVDQGDSKKQRVAKARHL